MNNRLYLLLHPKPDVEKKDTSLRYTDILFGFVIKELFVRLQNWSGVDTATQLQLIVGTVLVLSSWIGFRRSLNRSTFEAKFFNLPLAAFIVDQLMLIIYFRIAVLTPSSLDGSKIVPDSNLALTTTQLIFYVFVLYAVWDALGIWMCSSRRPDGVPRYPAINKEGEATDKPKDPNWSGFAITGLGVIFFMPWAFCFSVSPETRLGGSIAALAIYRFLKEVRTSWSSPQKSG